MSLDVYLEMEETQTVPDLIPLREDGTVKMLTRDEWRHRFPDREPITILSHETYEVYDDNITHNLHHMADAAGIYICLWRPEKMGITKAHQLVEPLKIGLNVLETEPERFLPLNPANGWGDYEGLVSFVRRYLGACKTHPTAKVTVWR